MNIGRKNYRVGLIGFVGGIASCLAIVALMGIVPEAYARKAKKKIKYRGFPGTNYDFEGFQSETMQITDAEAFWRVKDNVGNKESVMEAYVIRAKGIDFLVVVRLAGYINTSDTMAIARISN